MLKDLADGYQTKHLHITPQPHPLITVNGLKIQPQCGCVARRCHHKVYPHKQSNGSWSHHAT